MASKRELETRIERLEKAVFPPKNSAVTQLSGFSLQEDMAFVMSEDKANRRTINKIQKDFTSLLSYLKLRRAYNAFHPLNIPAFEKIPPKKKR